jgi:hypothetical protein
LILLDSDNEGDADTAGDRVVDSDPVGETAAEFVGEDVCDALSFAVALILAVTVLDSSRGVRETTGEPVAPAEVDGVLALNDVDSVSLVENDIVDVTVPLNVSILTAYWASAGNIQIDHPSNAPP